jgi:phytoene synthase
MARPDFCPEIANVVGRLLDAADWHYAQADAGIAQLPPACRPSIAAARVLYAEIGREVARRNHDSVSARAVVPGRRKVWLLLRTVCAQSVAILADQAMPRSVPATEESGFLVDAVRLSRLRASDPTRDSQGGLDQKVAWLVDLFVRLERQQHLEGQGQ